MNPKGGIHIPHDERYVHLHTINIKGDAMKTKIDSIWSVPAYLPYIHPQLTNEILEKAEDKIGYKLPLELVEILKIQNGGYLRYVLEEIDNRVIAGIGDSFPSLTLFDWEEEKEYISFQLEGLIPFDGDGHWHICLDYRESIHSPAVTYIDIENDEQSVIAKSFSKYLSLLQPEINNTIVLENIPSIDEVLKKLSIVLETSFPPPSDFDSGFNTYRASLGTETNAQWIWISPNEVPSVFARKGENRFEELKSFNNILKKQYSKIPDQSYLLNYTDGVKEKVYNACFQSNIKISELKNYI